MTQGPISNKPRILICRLSHIGDCVLTLPMLDAIRHRWPAAYIAWAMESPSHKLLGEHPGIDEIIPVPKGWLKSPRTVLRLKRELRKRQFGIAIDPQSLTKSSALGWISGAPIRLGFSGQHGREFSGWLNNLQVEPASDHLVDRSVELLQGIGIHECQPQLALPLNAVAVEFASEVQRDCDLQDRAWVIINPGASWPSKRWENDRFAEVALRLHQQTGIPALITWAGDAE